MKQRLQTLLVLSLAVSSIGASAQQATVGEVFATDASTKGMILLAGSGTQVASGSWLSAGASIATLRLVRGGNVRVCPGTSVTVTTSKSGTELMVSMNTGAIETNYVLDVGIDAIHTPDFRIQFFGPNTFHFAIGADAKGNTCVRTLPGNKGAAFVSELMGDGGYLIKEDDNVFFPKGRVEGAVRGSVEPCGCPPTLLLRAEATPPPKYEPLPEPPATPRPRPAEEVHMQVEAPFVFRATDPDPEFTRAVATLTTKPNRKLNLLLNPTVLPPTKKAAVTTATVEQPRVETTEPKPKKGVFSKVGSFFAKLFK